MGCSALRILARRAKEDYISHVGAANRLDKPFVEVSDVKYLGLLFYRFGKSGIGSLVGDRD